jgi:hypothetical protein
MRGSSGFKILNLPFSARPLSGAWFGGKRLRTIHRHIDAQAELARVTGKATTQHSVEEKRASMRKRVLMSWHRAAALFTPRDERCGTTAHSRRCRRRRTDEGRRRRQKGRPQRSRLVQTAKTPTGSALALRQCCGRLRGLRRAVGGSLPRLGGVILARLVSGASLGQQIVPSERRPALGGALNREVQLRVDEIRNRVPLLLRRRKRARGSTFGRQRSRSSASESQKTSGGV